MDKLVANIQKILSKAQQSSCINFQFYQYLLNIYFIQQPKSMGRTKPIKKHWSKEQDQILKFLRENLQIKKWSVISKKMEKDYGLLGRNQKKCRQRYQNHLNSSILNAKFTNDEYTKLFELHNEIGNRWSQIATKFKGRTDNFLKNVFHSKLRSSIRKLNRSVKQQLKMDIKPFPFQVLLNVLKASDSRKHCFSNDKNTYYLCMKIKLKLIEYSGCCTSKRFLKDLTQKQMTLSLLKDLTLFQEIHSNQMNGKQLAQKDSEQDIFDVALERYYVKTSAFNTIDSQISLFKKQSATQMSQRIQQFQEQLIESRTSSVATEYNLQKCKDSQNQQNSKYLNKFNFQKNEIEDQYAEEDKDINNLLAENQLQMPIIQPYSFSESSCIQFKQNQSANSMESNQYWLNNLIHGDKNQLSMMFE